jgi:hypothetical protein
MTLKRSMLAMMVSLVFTAISLNAAYAFCDVLRYTAAGVSAKEALRSANNQGLVEVAQLNKRYGNRVNYKPAATRCKTSNRVVCTITQRYCVAYGGKTGVPDTCPGDSVRNKRSQCVKKYEPVRAHPCSGGRIYSLSRKTCSCPDYSPVWTGQKCISSKPVAGPSNQEIIARCNTLSKECANNVPGSCRAMRQYCDRG